MTDSLRVRLTFCESSVFTRQIARLLSDEELNALQWVLMANPGRGDFIRASGGLAKSAGPGPGGANAADCVSSTTGTSPAARFSSSSPIRRTSRKTSLPLNSRL